VSTENPRDRPSRFVPGTPTPGGVVVTVFPLIANEYCSSVRSTSMRPILKSSDERNTFRDPASPSERQNAID
jgi:hypothetical protein